MRLNDCVGLVIVSVFNTTYNDLGTRSVFGLLKLAHDSLSNKNMD